jgi:signal transduction histidine kinase
MGLSDLAGVAPGSTARQLLHDARNHLWNLSGLGLLLAESSRHPDAALFARCLRNETQQIVHLLESLCAVDDGIDADEHETPFDVGDHLLVLAHALRPLAHDAGVQLQTSAPDVALPATGKPRLLNRVLGNLIRNAITHARARRVAVSVDIEPAGLRYTVRDDGIGVGAAASRSHCGSMAADPIGHGHGLAICASLALRMGATLKIGNRDGGGTDAQLVLPLRA